MSGRGVDGRWICLVGLAVYLGWLLAGGPVADYRTRWRQVGVDAREVSFLDLYLFPTARAELAAGGDPAVSNPTDPLARPYNYPRAWLLFMRFPAEPAVLAKVAAGLTGAALLALLACWGRLTLGQGALGALLLCSPAVMLGAERGNTDQFVFCLVAAGILLGWESGPGRRIATVLLWLAAVGLKLFPALAFAAWWRRDWRAALRGLLVPALIVGLYLVWNHLELGSVLRTTGSGWVLSYGTEVPAKALVQAAGYYQIAELDGAAWGLGFTVLAAVLAGGAAWLGWRFGSRALASITIPAVQRRGLLVGGLIYLGTFLAGNSFDYRQLFLLPVMPALWQLARTDNGLARLAQAGLAGLVLSTCINYRIAGWPGFFLNELGGWMLVPVLAALLAADFRAGRAAGNSPPT